MHDGLFADNVAKRELADYAGDVFLLHCTVLDLYTELVRRYSILADEHHAAGETIQAIAGKRVPLVPALRPHDFDNGVIIVATGGVDGDAGGLVDDYHVIVFVDYADGLGGYGRFMSMEGVGDDVAILNDRMNGGNWLAVNNHFTALYGVLLKCVSAGREESIERGVHVVFHWPVSKFSHEDTE